jgi:pimeloyl-ACP methyl ester carboxylesterase
MANVLRTTRAMAPQSPSLFLAGMEPIRATLELAGMLIGTNVDQCPRGNQEPVLVIPGLATSQLSTHFLRKGLNRLNYNAQDWGLGINKGPGNQPVAEWLAPVAETLQGLYEQTEKPVTLIGWSLGGIVAREVSRAYPEMVSKIITMGTPVRDLNTATNAKWVYELFHNNPPELSQEELSKLEAEPVVPCVAIYSRADGVVDWKACIQRDAKRTKHIGLEFASHLGMPVNQQIFQILAKELQNQKGP